MGLVFHLICLFYTVCITKLCQQRVSRKGTPAAAVGFRADCIEQFLSHYLLCYGKAKTLRILTDLLAIHMLYLMIHYVGDFMKFQLKLRTEVILFCSLVLFNSMLIIRAAQQDVSGCVSDCAALLYGNSSGAGYLCESEKRGFCLGGTCK